MKKVLITIMTSVMLLTAIITPVCAASFSDLAAEHWAYEYITTLADAKVINGYTDGTFRPNGTITRGEFIKLVMSSSLPENSDVTQIVPHINHWAAPYIKVAETYGVITENSINQSNVDEPITRIEMVRMISKADIIMNDNPQQFSEKVVFMDIADLNMNDIFLLRHSVSRGLIKGYDDGTFKPDRTMSRAEAATMIYRLTK